MNYTTTKFQAVIESITSSQQHVRKCALCITVTVLIGLEQCVDLKIEKLQICDEHFRWRIETTREVENQAEAGSVTRADEVKIPLSAVSCTKNIAPDFYSLNVR